MLSLSLFLSRLGSRGWGLPCLPPSGPFCLAQVTPARLTMHLQLLVLAALSGHVAALTGVRSLLGRLGWSQVQQPPHRRHLSEAGPLPGHRLTWMQQEKAPGSRSFHWEHSSPHRPGHPGRMRLSLASTGGPAPEPSGDGDGWVFSPRGGGPGYRNDTQSDSAQSPSPLGTPAPSQPASLPSFLQVILGKGTPRHSQDSLVGCPSVTVRMWGSLEGNTGGTKRREGVRGWGAGRGAGCTLGPSQGSSPPGHASWPRRGRAGGTAAQPKRPSPQTLRL